MLIWVVQKWWRLDVPLHTVILVHEYQTSEIVISTTVQANE